ncbi:Splicing factor Cactin [Cladobotryum mycophilum]|uniref:Splicing factor Cactin n=1 Tax=Cladobotryum mycophilum TaxID=491253 RepID=A0ABR0SLA1_9HYPO
MDPGRRAMISDTKEPRRRDATAPRIDPGNRISKSSKPGRSTTSRNAAKYLSQDEQSRQFVADEDKFVLKQSKKKADIRVREGRAKPIDFLAFNLRFIDLERDIFDDDEADHDIGVASPTKVIQDLTTIAQVNELDSDIKSYHILETDAKNRQYWEALRMLCTDQKAKLDPQNHEGRVVSSVSGDIDKILAPKSYEQLEALEKQIKTKLRSSEDIDTDYWEQLLRSLKVWKAKATLSRITDEIAKKRLDRLAERGSSLPSSSNQPHDATTIPTGQVEAKSASSGGSGMKMFRRLQWHCPARGPKPQWSEQYHARKPKYFNRVQMGYEWNKYNQTHYDHDNPPPKVVQGYKFNIFYPDLVDKTKAPTFKIIREHGRRRGESFAAAGEEDTCLIRFIAGPPYEDIAFRIVDREWDYSAKRERGFRSSFDKGILQLHFQFKKIFYRK